MNWSNSRSELFYDGIKHERQETTELLKQGKKIAKIRESVRNVRQMV